MLAFYLVFFLAASCSLQSIAESEKVGHVVVVTVPFFGHIIPALDLSKRLSVDHHVTYVVTASKLRELERRGLISNNDNNNSTPIQTQIEFIGLFDHNDDDPEVVNMNANFQLEAILDRMREPLAQLFSLSSSSSSSSLLSTRSITRPINMIITDLFDYVSVGLAHKMQIPVYYFMCGSFAALLDFINISTGNIQDPIMTQRFAQQYIGALPLTNGLICNSIAELEQPILDQLRQQKIPGANLPVRFVAPLLSDTEDSKELHTVAIVEKWLNDQWQIANGSPSVIYIAFGSMIRLIPEQIVEIARVLSSYPCIWSLKTQQQIHLPISFKANQSNLVLDWVPQRLILSHPAVRLFVSHGGWNSLLETMLAGKPTLAWPMFSDQFANANRLENDFGIGRAMKNTNINGKTVIVSSTEFEKYLRQMFDQESIYQEKALQIQKMMIHARDHVSRQSLEEISTMVNDQMITQAKERDEL